MLLPALLPKEYSAYASAETEEALLTALVAHPDDFVTFFEYACDDETWSITYTTFMKAALKWFTDRFLRNQLSLESAKRIVNAYELHFSILRNFIPLNLTVVVQKQSFQLNSLLFGVRSERFRDLIRAQHPQDSEVKLTLNDISTDLFSKIAEFCTVGNVVNLWREDLNYLFRLLNEATRLEIFGLQEQTEEVTKRYINKTNVIDILLQSHEKSWKKLRQSCFDFINDQAIGVKLSTGYHKRIDVSQKEILPLAFAFFDFREAALDLFERLRNHITQLICGTLIDEIPFSYVVNACPQMISLDISRSLEYSDRLEDIDSKLEQLDISKCTWMNDNYLKKMIALCPNLSRLALSGDEKITFRSWSELQNLPNLISLDISRSSQISDADFELILKSAPNLIELNLEECRRLSNKGFYALTRSLPRLGFLNISRTNISDAPLIEIASRNILLYELNIARCSEVTEKGILQTIVQAPSLKELKVNIDRISAATLEKIAALKPQLYLSEG